MSKVWQGADGTIYFESNDGCKTFMYFSDDSPDGIMVFQDSGDGPESIGEFGLDDLRNFLSVVDNWLEI